MRRLLATTLCILLTSTPIWSAVAQEQPEQAQDVEAQFKELTRQATRHYEEGNYAQAIAAFDQAYAIKPVSNILYNIGLIHEKLGNIDEAIDYYDRFVVSPNVKHASRQDALARLKTLREVREVQHGAAEEREQKAAAEQPKLTAPPEPQPQPDYTLAWIFSGVGATSLVGSGIFALLTSAQHRNYEEAATLDARRDAIRSGRTFAVIADSLLATGIATGILGGIFFLTSSSPAEQARSDEDSRSVEVSFAPILGPDHMGVGVGLSY